MDAEIIDSSAELEKLRLEWDALLTGDRTAISASAALTACLAAHRYGWDRCDLPDLRKQSPLCSVETPAELHSTVQLCSVIRLPETAAQFGQRRYRAKLEAEGPVEFETARSGPAIKKGVREFDPLRGSESCKSKWGARRASRLLLWPHSNPG